MIVGGVDAEGLKYVVVLVKYNFGLEGDLVVQWYVVRFLSKSIN
jgi:hypothetical protein